MTNIHLDEERIKREASKRWPDILRTLVPELLPALDAGPERHTSCPLPGHDDRNPSFRIDDPDEGRAVCTCGSYDGFGLVQKVRNWDFPTALGEVGRLLGVGTNNHPSKMLDIVAQVAALKRVSVAALQAYGATAADRDSVPVVRIPVYNELGQSHSYFDLGVGNDKLKKGLFRKGQGSSGLFFPGRMPETGEAWIMCEGPKDACAYHQLGFLACGLPTDRMASKYARLFAGCHVIIIPDRNLSAEAKAKKTAGTVFGVAASVRIGTLPLDIGGTNGDDARDVLRLNGGETLLRQAVADAKEWRPGGDDALPTRIKSDGLTKVLADAILEHDHVARDTGGRLYRFAEGAYRVQGERFVKARVKTLLEEWRCTKEWSPRKSDAVVEYIRVDAPELWERPPLELLNVKNGLLRLKDRVLLPHSPEHLSSVQLPVVYDPSASCPAIEKFVNDVFPEDATMLAYEIPAYLMLPDTNIQKAVLLLGPGGNGIRRARDERSPDLPPSPRRGGNRRLAYRSSGTASARGTVDGTIADRGCAWR
jgi:hypothetical protein